MDVKVLIIPTSQITDWNSFHDVFEQALGFPSFYGRNMDAWIDCMTYLDDPEAGMTAVTVRAGGIIILRIENASEFRTRCPEQYEALVECSAFVNWRRVENGHSPVLALMLVGHC